ncbi:Rab family GTPase [Legionella lytica]|uniref:Rab family GTPase n=1 Tax=Legionella lytica TaxID=96232 RepID=A0ABW8D9C8_9GAMM
MTNTKLPYLAIYKTCFVGNVVGKTALIARLRGEEFNPEYKYTIGASLLKGTLSLPSSSELRSDPAKPTKRTTPKAHIQYWDTAGQERFQILKQAFYAGTDVMFLCFDPLDEQSLQTLSSDLESITQPYMPILVETRIDRMLEQDADSVHKPIAEQIVTEFKQKHHISYHFKTSAKTGQGIEEINSFLSELYEAAYREHLAERAEFVAKFSADLDLRHPENKEEQGLSAAFILNFYPYYAVSGIAVIAAAIIIASTYTIPLAIAGTGLLGLATISFFKTPHNELKETQKIAADLTLSEIEAPPQPDF